MDIHFVYLNISTDFKTLTSNQKVTVFIKLESSDHSFFFTPSLTGYYQLQPMSDVNKSHLKM